jgi:Thrombospondin type 3 repeat
MRTGNASRIAALAVLVGFAGASSAAPPVTIPLGKANGVVGIYYNDNGNGELPTNQAYIRAQFSDTNTNGLVFNFDTTPLPGTGGAISWASLFQVVPNQFGLDLVLKSASSDGSVTIPTLNAYDNGNNTLSGRALAGPVTWAISGYTGSTDGPGDPGNGIINSLFRGGTGANAGNDGVTLTVSNLTVVGTQFTADVAGELQSDGLIHWYTIGTPDSPMSSFQLTGRLFFSGSLTYDSATDPYPLIDFYQGLVNIDAEVICGTRYVSPSGSDTMGSGLNFCRTSGSPCRSLQRTVDVACPGDTIQVGAGVYPEQIKITKSNLTLNAAPGAIVRPPTVTPGTDQGSPCSNGTGTALVLVSNATGVALNGLSVDGSLAATADPPRFVGIYYRNASGTISGGSVKDIRNDPLDGVQNGQAILVQAKGPNVAVVNTSGVGVSGYQKNGITYNGCGCANAVDGTAQGAITGNVITGAGSTPLIAQNGIQVGFGAGPVSISGNTISGDFYSGDPNNGTATGILLFSTTNNVVQGNTVDDSNTGVAMEGGSFDLCDPGDTVGNTVTCNRVQQNQVGVSTDASANTVGSNAIQDNDTGLDGSAIASGTLNAEHNWWGCATGANTGTCDTTTGPVDSTSFATSPPLCVSCTQNSDCNNGDSCSVADTCVAGVCHPGGGGDTDLDGTCNLDDNCPSSSNPSQVDSDGDGIGDACDACPLDANNDADGDGVCGNVDNCPNVANPGQQDIDGDSHGNACDPLPLNVTRVQMKRATKTPANGVAKTKGQFLLQLPGDVFNAASGISLAISDNNLINPNSSSHTFPPSECSSTTTKISCRSADKLYKAKFQTSPAAQGLWRFSATYKKQALTGPFLDPSQVDLTYGPAIYRSEKVTDCVLNFQKITCREF